MYCTGNSTQYSVMTYMGKEPEKEWIFVFVYNSLCYIPKNNTTLLVNYTPIKYFLK